MCKLMVQCCFPSCSCKHTSCSDNFVVHCHRVSTVIFPRHYTHTHSIVLQLFWILYATTWVSPYQKGKKQEGKTNLDLLEQEIVSGSGIKL